MILSKGLRIRVMERRDIENARKLHNDPSVLRQLTDVRIVSEAEQESWFLAMSKSSTSRRFIIEEVEGGDFVGVFRLVHLDMGNRNAMVGLDICPEKRGKKYAKIIYQWVFDYLFNDMGLHRLGLVTLESNAVAIKLYGSLGFQEEGRLREAIWRDGRFQDLIYFGLLRPAD